jgi:hypothetical protein
MIKCFTVLDFINLNHMKGQCFQINDTLIVKKSNDDVCAKTLNQIKII